MTNVEQSHLMSNRAEVSINQSIIENWSKFRIWFRKWFPEKPSFKSLTEGREWRKCCRLFQTRDLATVNVRSIVTDYWTPGMTITNNWCYRSVMSVGWVDRQQERVVPSTAAHLPAQRPCSRSALGRAASEGRQERRWCGPRISCGRSAVLQPPHSVCRRHAK